MSNSGLKIGLCTRVKKNLENESLPYQIDQPENKRLDELRVNSRPTTDLIIALKEVSCFHKDNQIAINFKSRPKFHSTKLEQSTFNVISDLSKIVTSTKIQENSLTNISNDLDSSEEINQSPNQIQNAYENQVYGSPQVSCTGQEEMQNQLTSYYSIQDFNLVNTTHFENENIYVCCLSYNGMFKGDLDLEFSEKVRLKHEIDNFALVQKISTGQTGYVPRNYITSLLDFENNN